MKTKYAKTKHVIDLVYNLIPFGIRRMSIFFYFDRGGKNKKKAIGRIFTLFFFSSKFQIKTYE